MVGCIDDHVSLSLRMGYYTRWEQYVQPVSKLNATAILAWYIWVFSITFNVLKSILTWFGTDWKINCKYIVMQSVCAPWNV